MVSSPGHQTDDEFNTSDAEQIRRRRMSKSASLFGGPPPEIRQDSKGSLSGSRKTISGEKRKSILGLPSATTTKWALVRSRIKAALFKGTTLASVVNTDNVVSMDGKMSGQVHPIIFLLPDGSHRTLRCDFGLTGNDLKRIVFETILRKLPEPTFDNVDSFVFFHEQSSEELTQDRMASPLRSLSALTRDLNDGEVGTEEDVVLTGDAPALRIVGIESDPLREHRLCCEQLVDRRRADCEEVRIFRKTVVKEMMHLKKALDEGEGDVDAGELTTSESDGEGLYGLADEAYPVYLSKMPLPASVAERFIVRVTLAESSDGASKGLMCDATVTSDEVETMAIKKFTIIGADVSETGADYILKVPGFKEYITGGHKLIDFDYVRRCLKKNQPITLILQLREDGNIVQRSQGLSELARNSSGSWRKMRGPGPIGIDYRKLYSSRSVILTRMIEKEFIVRVKGVDLDGSAAAALYERCKPLKAEEYFHWELELSLHYGGVLLCPVCSTPTVVGSENPRWEFVVRTGVKVCDLPLETRLCITLCKRAAYKSPQPVACVTMELFDYRNRLRSGTVAMKMWLSGDRANPLGPAVGNEEDAGPPVVVVELPSYNEAVFVHPHEASLEGASYADKNIKPTEEDEKKLRELVDKDPLYILLDDEKALLWKYRFWLVKFRRALPKVLVSTKWHDPNCAREGRALLHLWEKPKPAEALELLDSRFADQTIRDFAVECLHDMEDDDLAQYSLQLVQALKYERNLDNSLSLFLISRAVSSRIVGQCVFWNLKAELHSPLVKDRFSVLCEEFLKYAGATREELMNQHNVLRVVHDLAMKVKAVKKEERTGWLREAFAKVNLPPRFGLPLDPRLECSGIVAEKTKAFDSKKVPVLLIFKNADLQGKDNCVIYKAGDDLRQDALTLQLIRLMDKLWQREGLDLCMKPYSTVSTGDEQGMLEVVMHSETISNIQKTYGGIRGAFKVEPIKKWFDANRPQTITEAEQIDTFVRSLAGYCVATYVLGIGDRHNDNIMVSKFGHFFHIDFGHFLGNIKKKFGVKRERAPFVFTPDLAFAMGGKKSAKYSEFERLCCSAYNILRAHAHIFINLFSLMLSTGMPELRKPSDIDYLRDAFALTLNDDEAEAKFKALIDESLNCKTTLVNFAIHNLVH